MISTTNEKVKKEKISEMLSFVICCLTLCQTKIYMCEINWCFKNIVEML